ncbi:MAG: protein kinase [Bacteroidota bacterium]
MIRYRANQTFAQFYRLVDQIGQDQFYETWLAKDSKDKKVRLRIHTSGPMKDLAFFRDAQKRLEALQKLRHPLLLIPTKVDTWKETPYEIQPFIEEGSVRQTAGNFPERRLAQLLYQVGLGLQMLHQQDDPFIHQHICPENILVNSEGNFVICDMITNRQMLARQAGGIKATPYSSAESTQDRTPQEANDIFSLGASLYELATNSLPLGEKGGQKQVDGAWVPDLPKQFSPRFNQIVQVCMAQVPAGRPDPNTLILLAEGYLETDNWRSVPGFAFAPTRHYKEKESSLGPLFQKLRGSFGKVFQNPIVRMVGLAGLALLLLVGLVQFTPIGEWLSNDSPEKPESVVKVDQPDGDLVELNKILRVKLELDQSVESIRNQSNRLSPTDLLYLKRIERDLLRVDQQMDSMVSYVNVQETEIKSWQKGKDNEVWLGEMKENLNRYRRNLILIQDRVEE